MHDRKQPKRCICGELLEERWKYCPMCGRHLTPEWVLAYDPLYPNRGYWHKDTDPRVIRTTGP